MQNQQFELQSERLLSLNEVRTALGGLCTSTVYRLAREGILPRQVHIAGTNRVAWRAREIKEYLDGLQPVALRAPLEPLGKGGAA